MSAFDTGKKTIVPGETPGQNDIGWLSYNGKPLWNNGAKFSTGATFDSIADVPEGVVGQVWIGDKLFNGTGTALLATNASLPALAEFEDKLLLTNIDNITWSFSGSTGVTSELSTEHARHNTNTLKVVCPAESSKNGYGDGSFPSALDLTAYEYIEFAVWADGRSGSSPSWCSVYFMSSEAGSTADHFTITLALYKPGWNICRIAKTEFTSSGDPNWNNIVWARLRCNSSTESARTVYFAEVHAVKSAQNRAVVSLGFDDGPISQYHAATIAASRGIKVSFFLIRQLLNGVGYLTNNQLDKMLAMGHELGIHGADSPYDNWVEQYTAQGYDTFVAALIDNSAYFKSIGVDTEIASWPQGAYSDTVELDPYGGAVVAAVRDAGIKYCRLTRVADVATGRHYAQYNTLYPRDGLFISGGLSLNNSNNLAAVKAQIDDAILNGSWINIYGHVLAATAADGVTWAKSDYIELIDYLAAKRDAGLLDIRPFGEVARELHKNGYITTVNES